MVDMYSRDQNQFMDSGFKSAFLSATDYLAVSDFIHYTEYIRVINVQ